MDDSFERAGVTVDTDRRTIEMTNYADESRIARLTFVQSSVDSLVLDGEMDGHKVHMLLERVDTNTFTLLNRGFHWVQEFPYNR
jgi:hypothetical protein